MKRLCLTLLLVSLASFAQAQIKPVTVLDGLDNPCGVAVQPETGHVFVADSGGKRIIRVVDGKAEDVITGFTLDVYGKGPMYNIGPLGLVFLDKDTLVVGGGGKPDTEEEVSAYKVPAAGEKAIDAGDTIASYSLPNSEELRAEGNYYGVAATKTAVFATANGDDTKGWIVKAPIEEGKITGLERSIATKEATQVDAPVAITVSPRGELVVGQMGEINVPKDSLLTFYDAKTGKMLLNLETGLYDPTGLAYSPKGHLYATDFAWMASEEGGLFQLVASKNDDGKQGITAHKVVGLDKPTAITFGEDGTLYITVIGTSEGDSKGGKLLSLAPGL